LLPNKNGRLLSVCGNCRLVVVCLPRQGFSGVSDSRILSSRKRIDCRTLSVGAKYYDISKFDILNVQWHHLSDTRTHIVVLGSDNMLR
jgi:nucleoporin NUP82